MKIHMHNYNCQRCTLAQLWLSFGSLTFELIKNTNRRFGTMLQNLARININMPGQTIAAEV
jgi:hypothetical protein